MITFRLPSAMALLAMALVATGCTDSPGATEDTADARIEVVASTSVYGAIAADVGGDRVAVTSIIDSPNSDPEEYEATPADAAAVASAQVVIVNGGGYDPFLPRLIETAGGEREVLVATEVSGLQPADPDDEFNEHVWFSLPAMQELATALASTLGDVSPDDADAFEANAAALTSELDDLQDQVGEITSRHEGARVAATEPLPLYLLEDAGLDNVTPEQFMEASEEGSDAPAAIVQETLELFGDDPVRVLFLNTQTQTPATDRVQQAAREAGVPVVEVNETLPDGVERYPAWMGAQVDAMATALDQSP